jgi:hypothetical protein
MGDKSGILPPNPSDFHTRSGSSSCWARNCLRIDDGHRILLGCLRISDKWLDTAPNSIFLLLRLSERLIETTDKSVNTTVKHRLNVTEQAMHACVHPPYHDPPGVSAYCRQSFPNSIRCGEVHRLMQESGCECVCAGRLLPSRLAIFLHSLFRL